jgi:plasmid stabilization system protein ParE
LTSYPVIFSEDAEQRLAALEAYLAERFYPANADRFVRRLIAACESLG